MNDPITRIADALEKIAALMQAQAQPQPEALDKEAAARFIGATPETIEHLIKTRKLTYVQYGSQRGRLIPVEALREFLAAFRREAMNGNGHE